MADRAETDIPDGPSDAPNAAAPQDAKSRQCRSQRPCSMSMHTHQQPNTWRDFFIHIATICVGLLIALGLEQTVEALHHHHQREQLLVSLDHDTQATLQDADFAVGERLRRMQWNEARIEQVQNGAGVHTLNATSATPQKSAFITVPADPTWEAARASGMIPLYRRGRNRPSPAKSPMSAAAQDLAMIRKEMLTLIGAILKNATSPRMRMQKATTGSNRLPTCRPIWTCCSQSRVPLNAPAS